MFCGPELLRRMIAAKTELPLDVVEKVLAAREEIVLQNISAGMKVRDLGIGYFTLRKAKETRRRNPQTKRLIKVPAKEVVVFRLSRNK